MSGTKAGWTPERRVAQAERCRQQMADPARRAMQAKVLRAVRLNPKHRPAWLEARRKPERRAVDSQTIRRVRADEQTEQRRKRRAAAKRKDRFDRDRGGRVPEGYETLYRHLRVSKKYTAKEALRLVRLQRAADLKRAA